MYVRTYVKLTDTNHAELFFLPNEKSGLLVDFLVKFNFKQI